MYGSTHELIESLQATPDVLHTLLQDVTPVQAQAARGGDEGWSVVEVVCHLRDAEEYALGRMRALRDHEMPVIAGFDQEAWARERNYAAADLHEAFTAWLHFREQHVAELAALTPEQWQRSGQHVQHGPVTILNHRLHVVWHDAVHTAQIARQLSKVSRTKNKE